jgi:hypothetical protein
MNGAGAQESLPGQDVITQGELKNIEPVVSRLLRLPSNWNEAARVKFVRSASQRV